MLLTNHQKLLQSSTKSSPTEEQILYRSNSKLHKLYSNPTLNPWVSILISSPALLISHQLTQGLSRHQNKQKRPWELSKKCMLLNVKYNMYIIYIIYTWDLCNISTHRVFMVRRIFKWKKMKEEHSKTNSDIRFQWKHWLCNDRK